ncbi:MAG TPA: adenylosuccinate synthetase, partial [Clostridia bacterium]|nr:adenylosuccinate synthetase [Clostridia bacterium]
DYMPSARDLYKVEPVYVTMEGWLQSTKGVRKYEDLPENAQKYISLIEEYTGVKVKYIGVGPARDEIIVK